MNVIAPRLLDGHARWGTVDTSPASPGIWQRIRLTVYPPGITPAERRLLRICHGWPVGGAILSLFGLVALSDAGPVLSIGLVLTAYVAVWVALSRVTAELRSRCRVVTVATEYVRGELHVFGDADVLRSAVSRLRALELARRSGLVDPVDYELAWSEVYQDLPSTGELTSTDDPTWRGAEQAQQRDARSERARHPVRRSRADGQSESAPGTRRAGHEPGTHDGDHRSG